jgi:Zn-dependent protease
LPAQRLKLGRFFGIELFVHWSFGLVVAYVAFSAYSVGGSAAMIAFSVAQLLTVFLCVTMHEYGHSLAARRYGVDTVDITLLPIGGVARLKRIPRVPVQELIIAIAGPAVNVVIAALIGGFLVTITGLEQLALLGRASIGFATTGLDEPSYELIAETFTQPSLLGFAIVVFAINMMLVLFNMIPAFPMDGGRVLRSLLAMLLPYGAATRWAQRIGVVCAALMAAYAISSEPPKLVMLAIAAFIVYAGGMEAKQVDLSLKLNSLLVGDVMSRQAPVVSIDCPVDQLSRWWQDQTYPAVAVIGLGDVVVGTLTIGDLARHMESLENLPPRTIPITAGELADHDSPALEADMPLESIIGGIQKHRQLPVVDHQYRLIGWLDYDTVFARAMLYRTRQRRGAQETAKPEPPNFLFAL